MLWTSLLAIFLTSGSTNAAVVHKCPNVKTVHARPTLAEVKHSFKEAKIVPDLLPVFKPSSLLYLSYPNSPLKKNKNTKQKDSKTVLPGRKFAKDETAFKPVTETLPEISLEGPGWPGAYVFFLLDPDAPSRSNPKWSQVRHMFMGNLTIDGFSKHVPGSIVLTNQSIPINDYKPPAPPAGTGPHRYVALLYAQPADFDYSFLNVTERQKFNITEFSERSGLGTPLAGTFMTVKVKEDEDDDASWLPSIQEVWSHLRQVALRTFF